MTVPIVRYACNRLHNNFQLKCCRIQGLIGSLFSRPRPICTGLHLTSICNTGPVADKNFWMLQFVPSTPFGNQNEGKCVTCKKHTFSQQDAMSVMPRFGETNEWNPAVFTVTYTIYVNNQSEYKVSAAISATFNIYNCSV